MEITENGELMVQQVEETARRKTDFSVIDLLRVPVFVAGMDTKVIYANDVFAELMGRGRDQVVGSFLGSMVNSEVSGIERALRGENVHIKSWATIRGKKFFLEYIPTPLVDSKGNVTGVIEVVEDLTDQKLALQAVKGLVEKANEGDLSSRAEIEAEGDYGELINGFNQLLDAVMTPTQECIGVILELSKGNTDARVRGEYKGDYNVTKNALNETMEVLDGYINEIAAVLTEIGKHNLTVEITGEFRGRFSVIKEAINLILVSLNKMLAEINTVADQVATGSQQVAEASQELSQGATEAAGSLEEIASSVQQLTSQTEQNSENASQANQMTTNARATAEKGNERMGAMVKAMSEINESSTNISKIIKAIDEIAFQTNLLALNAAVEAARAGKHGKGFTVVAEEVRNLAQRSAAAAKETAEMIEDSIKRTEAGNKIAEDTAAALQEIITETAKVADLVGEIGSASKEQAQGVGEVNQALSQLDQVTQEVSSSSEESAAASEQLSGQVMQLTGMLDNFKLRQNTGVANGFELPPGVTPQMLQMLQKMMQAQPVATGAVTGGGRTSKEAGRYPGSRSGSKAVKPEDLIALDDGDFGRF